MSVETEVRDDSLDPRALDAALPEIDWAHLPDGAERIELKVPSGTLAGYRLGPADGRPVLLVPGVTGSKEDFAFVAPMVAAAGYSVTAFDLAGQYESASAGPEWLVPPRRRYDDALFVDDLLTVLADLAAPAHVLGYSYAGTIAQLALRRHPERFASLTLMSAPPLAGQVFRAMKGIGPLTGLGSARVAGSLMIWGVRRNVVRASPSRIAFVRARFARTRRESVAEVLGSMRRTPDLRSAVRDSGVPVLVAVGEHDIWPSGLHRAFAESIGAIFAAYPSGHAPCETSPHQLSRDLLALYAIADGGATATRAAN